MKKRKMTFVDWMAVAVIVCKIAGAISWKWFFGLYGGLWLFNLVYMLIDGCEKAKEEKHL